MIISGQNGAEIEFDDGTILRREYFWTSQGNRQNIYVNSEIGKLESEKLRLQTSAAVEKRIKQLAAQEKDFNARIAELEGNLALADKFQHEKIQHIEEKNNGNFEHARFKLFDCLIDGTARETCEAMLGGVRLES